MGNILGARKEQEETTECKEEEEKKTTNQMKKRKNRTNKQDEERKRRTGKEEEEAKTEGKCRQKINRYRCWCTRWVASGQEVWVRAS